jgi:hypothetical protein
MNQRRLSRLLWLAGAIGLFALPVAADDDVVKEGGATPRYPDYTYEGELPRTPHFVPGASSGLFYERHTYSDQFMGRWRADYVNYGWKNYENYRLNTTPYLRTYDNFGNYIADGYEIFRLEEFRTRSPAVGSVGIKGQFYQNWLRHLVIADDSYGRWSTRLIIGDYIHTTFTPLTLDMTGFNGVRFDAISSGTQQFSLIFSRISDPMKIGIRVAGAGAPTDLGTSGKSQNRDDGAYLMGGHWENDISGAFVIGATYLTLHRFDAARGFRTNSRKGLAPQNTVPQRITLRFEDDSPEDGVGGAAVFDVVATATLAPPVDGEAEVGAVVSIAPIEIDVSPGVVQIGRHLEANGLFRDEDGIDRSNYIDYVFEVPEDVVDLEFSVLLANDYKISMRQDHFFVTDPVRGSGQARQTNFAMIRRADGDVSDLSNLERIEFDYGLATGIEVYGVNGRLTLPGLEIQGEIVGSRNHFQYPTLLGTRSDFDDWAGYVTATKSLSTCVDLGIELFTVGKAFTGLNPHPSAPDARIGETFYFNDPRQQFYRGPGTVTSEPYYVLVDDNDNMLYSEIADQWIGTSGIPFEAGDGRAGIYPAFDLDQDGHPDSNRNRNEFSDWDEPFLMYFTDPDVFYFGDDYNNNGITDAWEDDSLPNYPYYKDERGRHLNLSSRPFAGLTLTAGRYAVEQLAGSGANDVSYGRLRYDRRIGKSLRLRLEHETKDVADDIANDYFRFLLREGISSAGARYTATFFADPLQSRDSFVNRGLARAEYHPSAAWHAEAKFRYEFNHQRRRSFQQEDDLRFWGTVVRAGYVHRWRNVDIMPRAKFLFQTQTRDSIDAPIIESLQLFPILRADWHITASSQIRFGLQGFPLLKDFRRDRVNEANDSDRLSWTIMWFNQSEYEGYIIGTEVGLTRRDVDFNQRDQADTRFTRFFVRIISAVGGVVR